jgi:hypothetical protein
MALYISYGLVRICRTYNGDTTCLRHSHRNDDARTNAVGKSVCIANRDSRAYSQPDTVAHSTSTSANLHRYTYIYSNQCASIALTATSWSHQ